MAPHDVMRILATVRIIIRKWKIKMPNNKTKMEAYGREYAELQKEWSKKVPLNFGNDEQRKMYFDQMRKNWAELGLDYDKMMAKADQFVGHRRSFIWYGR